MDLAHVWVDALDLLIEHLGRPCVETAIDDRPGRLDRGDGLRCASRVVEVVLPSRVCDRVGPRRPVGARLADDAAQPVHAGRHRVTDRRPDRPALRRGPDRELLLGHRSDDLGETPVVLRPAVVEPADRHQPSVDAKARHDRRMAKRAAPPAFIPPMLATLTGAPFDDPDWLFEVKWDGFRVEAIVHARSARLWTRGEQDAARYFGPFLAPPTWLAARRPIG